MAEQAETITVVDDALIGVGRGKGGEGLGKKRPLKEPQDPTAKKQKVESGEAAETTEAAAESAPAEAEKSSLRLYVEAEKEAEKTKAAPAEAEKTEEPEKTTEPENPAAAEEPAPEKAAEVTTTEHWGAVAE